ncbi:MAG: RloB family protein [Caldisericia bacterium]
MTKNNNKGRYGIGRDSSRIQKKRPLRKVLIIQTEGLTEFSYFKGFKSNEIRVFDIKIYKGKGGGANKILEELENHISENYQSIDENFYSCWIVIDTDKKGKGDVCFQKINTWNKKDNNNLILTNPEFEYWLLLHFEDGCKNSHKKDCINELGKHLSGYDPNHKSLNQSQISKLMNNLDTALSNAKARAFNNWPDQLGQTNVHLLVEEIQKKDS